MIKEQKASSCSNKLLTIKDSIFSSFRHAKWEFGGFLIAGYSGFSAGSLSAFHLGTGEFKKAALYGIVGITLLAASAFLDKKTIYALING